jgi:hypothetical protein
MKPNFLNLLESFIKIITSVIEKPAIDGENWEVERSGSAWARKIKKNYILTQNFKVPYVPTSSYLTSDIYVS